MTTTPPGRPPARGSAPSRPTGTAARSTGTPLRSAPAQRRPGRSAVEMLVATQIGEPTPPAAQSAAGSAKAGSHTRAGGPGEAASNTAPPTPLADVTLGAAVTVAEVLWRWGARGAGLVGAGTSRALGLVGAVAPAYAVNRAQAQIQAFADRGRSVRQERREGLTTALSNAMATAAASEAMHDLTVTAIEEATDDVLAVVLPAMLEAVTDAETQAKLDEVMAGLLTRQLPDALERTLPGVMLRTATKTSLGLVPSLMGALTSGLTGEANPPGERRQ